MDRPIFIVMKKSNYSKIFAGFNLILLTAFLCFWLYGEYKDEYRGLENELHLEIAEELVSYSGLDLNMIIKGLKDSADVGRLEVSVIHSEDGVVGEGSTKFLDDSFPDSGQDQGITTKRQVIQRVYPDSTRGDSLTREVQVVYGGVVTLSSDSLSRELDIWKDDLKVQLKDKFDQESQGLGWTAFWNILPQFGFALLLLLISALAIYFLQRNYRERQEALKSKNQLISNITHELKTPVATIGVALEAIQDYNVQADPVKANAYLTTSRNELNRLSMLIDRVLQFSQIDEGQQLYDLRTQALRPLVEEVVSAMQLPAQHRQIKIHTIFEGEHLSAKVDTMHFKNVLQSLLDNSLKYGKEGGRIDIELQAQGQQLELTIQDDGPGIPRQYQSKVFERFFRVPQGDLHNVKGYGLGLSYAAEVIKAHRGEIDLQSDTGKGTTIKIKLDKSNGITEDTLR